MARRPDTLNDPRTPSEHYAEALSLLRDAQDYGPNTPAALTITMRANTHATLALYKAPRTVATAR